MSFMDSVNEDLARLLSSDGEVSETISYTPGGGAAQDISVVVERDNITRFADDHKFKSVKVLIDTNDVVPKINDLATIDGEEYSVQQLIEKAGRFHKVEMVADVRREY